MANEPNTVIVERSGGNGLTAVLVIVIVALIAVTAYFLISGESDKNSAISTAAGQIGDAAQQAGDAAQDAAKKQ